MATLKISLGGTFNYVDLYMRKGRVGRGEREAGAYGITDYNNLCVIMVYAKRLT